MCEPKHSIVQFPDQDPDGNPTESLLDRFVGWGKKKIKSWFHYSKMGLGHSESLRLLPQARKRLPDDTRYEAYWWNRNVIRDGKFYGHDFEEAEALEVAIEYANRVSIGNMTLLRQFLERSIKTSEHPIGYVDQFLHGMLTKEGRDQCVKKIEKIGGAVASLLKRDKDTLIKCLFGFTRKRSLLVPEWADDNALWTPTPRLIEVQ